MSNVNLETAPILAAACAAALACAACASVRPKTPPPAPAPAAAAAPAPAAAPAASASSAAPAADPPPVSVPQGKRTKVRGVVTAVDGGAGTLTIRDSSGASRSLRTAVETKFTKGGDNASILLSDISAGDHVSMSVVSDVAASVHVMILAAPAK